MLLMLTASIGCGVGWAAAISSCPVLRWGEAAEVVSSLLRANGALALPGWLLIGASGGRSARNACGRFRFSDVAGLGADAV